MSVLLVLSIIFIHWFADFVCQTDKQALNKSHDNEALTEHVLVYSWIWFLMSALYGGITHSQSPTILWFAPITFVCHWITDYYTSRANAQLWKEDKRHGFFVSLGFDQVLHYVQLFLTFYLLTR